MRGAFRRPTAGGDGVLDSKSKSWPNSSSLRSSASKPRPRSPDYPLSISPPGSAHSAGTAQKNLPRLFLSIFFDFLAFQNVFQILLRKIIEKNAKIEVFSCPKPSPNPCKTPPKSMFQQTCDFSSIFVRKSLCSKSADIDFVLVFTIQNGSRTFFFELLFACIFDPKNLPKTSRKPCPGGFKILLENALFFYIGL